MNTTCLIRLCIALMAMLLYAGCTHYSGSSHSDQSALDAMMWMQESEEYRALTLGVYNVARTNLDHVAKPGVWFVGTASL